MSISHDFAELAKLVDSAIVDCQSEDECRQEIERYQVDGGRLVEAAARAGLIRPQYNGTDVVDHHVFWSRHFLGALMEFGPEQLGVRREYHVLDGRRVEFAALPTSSNYTLRQWRRRGNDVAETMRRLAAIVAEREPKIATAMPQFCFRMTGDTWELCFADEAAHFKDCKGLQYIQRLLKFPEKRFTCPELQDGGERPLRHDVADAMEQLPQSAQKQLVIDKTAQANLQEWLDKEYPAAMQEADEEAKEQLELNHKKVLAVLANQGDTFYEKTAKSAKVAVKKGIDRALDKMKDSMPNLYEHLQSSIVTGASCQYAPQRKLVWEFF